MLKYVLILFLSLIPLNGLNANLLSDTDKDGVPDQDEINVYFTDMHNPDTDGDGYSDWVELISGFSPHNPKPIFLKDNDQDKDGLNDKMELKFHTNLTNPDTDGDGFNDYIEIQGGYNPLSKEPELLEKRIEVNLAKQELYYYLAGVRMGEYSVSSGKRSTPTPTGHFEIVNKSLKAWSGYGLWMPFWMGLDRGRIGLHELPVWPSGYREGEDHLGTPVSHGCVRLGVKAAEAMYNWAPVGTKVFIY